MDVLAGRYTLVEQVGEGGMSVVWRARDERLEREVAIKLLRSFVAAEPEQRQRFEREARTLAGLASDHVVRVYDYVDAPEQPFLVLEYVAGGNLAQATFSRLPLPPAEAAAYTAPVAAGLAYAHARLVVHRDLTPTNILIERSTGRVLTSDFGLARIARGAGSLTAPGVLIGTPEYWSPEHALGHETSGPADVYALGCILFLLLTARLPFEGEDRLAVGLRRAHEDAPPLRSVLPRADPEAARLVDSLLAREPALRPDAATAASTLEALAQGAAAAMAAAAVPGDGAAGASTLALPAERPTAKLEPEPRAARKRGRPTVALALAGIATAGLALVLVTQELSSSGPRAPNVVTLRESAARARIGRLLPGMPVSVRRAYSTTVAAGLVMRQRPAARDRIDAGHGMRLVVSKGTPYASVPPVQGAAAAARAALARSGFAARYRYQPSWTTRKGGVIELRPASGTRLRRPATVTILVASGYPRSVVPNVETADLATAQAQLSAKHLRSQVVYLLAPSQPENRVLRQLPAAGATVYSGTRVRLTVARQLRWVTVFSQSGSGAWESDTFTVPRQWRIRYRLVGRGFFPPAAQLSWAQDGDLFADGTFVARRPGPHTYAVSRPGTYRLGITPYAATAWSVAVDALE